MVGREGKAGNSRTLVLFDPSELDWMDSPSQETFKLKIYSDSPVYPPMGTAAWLHQATRSELVITEITQWHHADTSWHPFSCCLGGSNSCGGVISSLSGSFSSPLYPENYPTDIQCVWEIHVDKKFRIELMIPSLK